MKRIKSLIILCSLIVFCLMLCSASTLFAQSSVTQASGQIKGVVMDVQDARVPAAIIKIVGKDFKWEGMADSEGEFTADVPPGTYRIYVASPGFRKFESAFLKVKSNVIELVNIHLDIAPASGPVRVEP
jgi:hypothetical protein